MTTKQKTQDDFSSYEEYEEYLQDQLSEELAASRNQSRAKQDSHTTNDEVKLPYNLRFASSYTENETDINWIVDGWLRAGRLTLLYGEEGSGKTTFLTTLSLLFEAGIEDGFAPLEDNGLDSLKINQYGGILYIVADRQPEDVAAIAQQVMKGMDLDADILLMPYHKSGLDFRSNGDLNEIRDIILTSADTEYPIKLVVLDSLYAILDDMDIKSPRVGSQILNSINKVIAQTGVGWIVSGHKTKTTDTYQGDPTTRAAVDQAIEMTKVSEDTFRLKCTKANRGGVVRNEVYIKADWNKYNFGVCPKPEKCSGPGKVTEATIWIYDNAEEHLLGLSKSKAGKVIETFVGLGRDAALKLINDLIEQGYFSVPNDIKKGQPCVLSAGENFK